MGKKNKDNKGLNFPVIDALSGNPEVQIEKEVIICRTGLQVYTKAEAERLCPYIKFERSFYTVFRPLEAIVRAHANLKFNNITLTKEHPSEFLNMDNWKYHTQGNTASEAELVELGSGEFGVKTSLFFANSDAYNYYLSGNKEVSLGYRGNFVCLDEDMAEEKGYDIIMTDITNVNHLALTQRGRAGEEVRVADSLTGGRKMAKTNILAKILGKGKDAKVSDSLFTELNKAKSMDEKKREEACDAFVADSLSFLTDSDEKSELISAVEDCFLRPDIVLSNKKEASVILDSAYGAALNVEDACAKDKDEDEATKDSKDEDEDKDAKDSKDEDKDAKDSKDEDKDAKGSTKDSADEIGKAIDAALGKLPELVEKAVTKQIETSFEALGLSQKKPVDNPVTDSVSDESGIDLSTCV